MVVHLRSVGLGCQKSLASDVEGWANGLSLVKELTIHNGKLFQYPVSETEMLRQSATTLSNGCHFLSTASLN